MLALVSARTHILTIVLLATIQGFAYAQEASISGVVRDATSGVMPGVTVEVTSPALIERVRTSVTNAQGLYRVLSLPPGTYTVTFTLDGFTTISREDVELSSGFTANIGAEMAVGNVTETVTVTGASPVVDVQNVRTQRVMNRETIDVIPTGSRSFDNLGALIPGVSVNAAFTSRQDVGGTAANGLQWLAIHGGRTRDQQQSVDGMYVGAIHAVDGSSTFNGFADGATQEITLGISAHSAEAETGGIQVNIIPKSGGNDFSGNVYATWANRGMQSDNFDSELASKGLKAPNPINYLSDFSPTIGGPIKRDRLWFFGGFRDWRRSTLETDRYADTSTSDFVYTPDMSVEPENRSVTRDVFGRMTWQVSPRNKLSFFHDFNRKAEPFNKGGGTQQARQALQDTTTDFRITQVTWSAPISNNLLFDAGFSLSTILFTTRLQSDAVPPAITERSCNCLFNATRLNFPGVPRFVGHQGPRDVTGQNYQIKAAMTYVTGGHNFKVGLVLHPAHAFTDVFAYGKDALNYDLLLLNGVPNRVVYTSLPYVIEDSYLKTALFAQDQWTVGRMTANLGLRFEMMTTSYPDYQIEATPWVPARTYTGKEVLNWKDMSPRLGVSYDVFGTGRTAIKASLSRYVTAQTNDVTRRVNPPIASTNTLQRTWTDLNGDFKPQGDPTNPAAHEELGPSPNENFGKPIVPITYDPNWTHGFGIRPSQWELSAGIQHELRPGLSAEATFFRRSYGNFDVIENLSVSPSDYDPYCITAPSDSRLKGGGGQQVCGLYDLNPAKVGQVSRYRTVESAFGDRSQTWQGFDLSVNGRIRDLVTLQGGLSSGSATTDTCNVTVDNPSKLYCHTEEPYLTQVKLMGSVNLPWQVTVAASVQSIPGAQVGGTYIALNSEIQPSLGRALSTRSTAAVNIVEPGTTYAERLNQVDLRLTWRPPTLGESTRLRVNLDLFNMTNGNAVLSHSNTYGRNGATWLRPTRILTGRVLKIGAQVDF
jgi:hypothetical protein